MIELKSYFGGKMMWYTKELIFELLKILLVLAVIALILIVGNPHWVFGAHWQSETREWRSDYHGRNNMGCCGEEDCWIAQTRVIEQGPETSTVEIDGLIIEDFPNSAIHISQDMNGYACHPYQVQDEFDGMPYKLDGTKGWCNKHTKDPTCINCIFVTGGM